jgi:endonuclease/exonuclease/phosphatase family metal-dependent hydrolase
MGIGFARTVEAMRLRIVTYNIHRAIGVDRRFRPDRVGKILAHHAPDLILLQEVDDGVPRSRELDMARNLALTLGYPHYAVGHNVTLRKGRYGNATLSRFPIIAERNINLTVGSKKRRGCQHTTIRVTDNGRVRDLEVFNLHLGLSASERSRQVGMLYRSKQFTAVNSTQACLVGGDFNDWRSILHPIFTEILGFGCATQHDFGYNGAIRTYPSFSPQGGLDKLYFRGAMRVLGARRCRLRTSRVASDHLPIIADFELD